MNKNDSVLNYTFKDKNLLKYALIHSSYANEARLPEGSNERLEFLGDSVLSLVVSQHLYKNFSSLPEGELTKLRATLVCEKSLHKFALEINLGERMHFGKGEAHTGGASRPSILADAFEAVIAAIYLDGGFEKAKEFVMHFVDQELSHLNKDVVLDFKTTLQEVIQQNPEERLQYNVLDESGPDHNKVFSVEVRLNSNVIGVGKGRSKKEAEQAAAHEALKLMGIK